MSYYKIKNITNTLAKRHIKVNTTQTVEFKDIISSQLISISPGSEIIVEATLLPVSAQKLRTEGLISVIEIDKNSYQKLLNAQEKRNLIQLASTANQSAKIDDSEDKLKKIKQKNR